MVCERVHQSHSGLNLYILHVYISFSLRGAVKNSGLYDIRHLVSRKGNSVYMFLVYSFHLFRSLFENGAEQKNSKKNREKKNPADYKDQRVFHSSSCFFSFFNSYWPITTTMNLLSPFMKYIYINYQKRKDFFLLSLYTYFFLFNSPIP